MCDVSRRYWIIFNGEIYNYLELRAQLESDYTFRTKTDTEVLLAAFLHWGEACLDRLVGMFAFVIWDERERKAFGARDRFGIKPLYVHELPDGGVLIGSEIKAFHAAGVPRLEDEVAWATYLASGMYDHSDRTFWKGIRRVAPGTRLTWTAERGLSLTRWYDVAASVLKKGPDTRPEAEVADELHGLLEETVLLRFRSDVPVGICLSGGLDSSLLLGLVRRVVGRSSEVKTFTFFCDDPRYDEVPWVKRMLSWTGQPSHFCRLTSEEVPALAESVHYSQDEPFGGLPTLGMAKVHARAHQEGVVVLLDGNGLDEGWGGYEYYQRADRIDLRMGPVQGARARSTRPDCLSSEFASLAEPVEVSAPFGDPLRDLQCRDIRVAKIPRAMRFADRVSMMYSRELREPFLDHRIIELGLRQPADRKIRDGQGKWLIRQLAKRILPDGIRQAPKRPVQTPQREWLRGPLQHWAWEKAEQALRTSPEWFKADRLRSALHDFVHGEGDSSFFVWQVINLGIARCSPPVSVTAE